MRSGGLRTIVKGPDPPHLARLLRVGGERRKNKAQNDR
jgi:hypothetical protein